MLCYLLVLQAHFWMLTPITSPKIAKHRYSHFHNRYCSTLVVAHKWLFRRDDEASATHCNGLFDFWTKEQTQTQCGGFKRVSVPGHGGPPKMLYEEVQYTVVAGIAQQLGGLSPLKKLETEQKLLDWWGSPFSGSGWEHFVSCRIS